MPTVAQAANQPSKPAAHLHLRSLQHSPSQISSLPPSTSSAGTSPTKERCVWVLGGSSSFTQSLIINFSVSNTLPSTLNISTDHIKASGTAPYTQNYTIDNVAFQDGTMQLKVPGAQKNLSHLRRRGLHSRKLHPVRQRAHNDASQPRRRNSIESIFLLLRQSRSRHRSHYADTSNNGVHSTNQKLNTNNAAATQRVPLNPDLTTAFHEYRLDWLPDPTDFYLDGVLQANSTENVPIMAGKWIWNNWR